MDKKESLNTELKNEATFKGVNNKPESENVHSYNFKKDASLGGKIDQIFHESDNVNEIESKVILLLLNHTSNLQTNQDAGGEKVDIAKDISRIIKTATDKKIHGEKKEEIESKAASSLQEKEPRHITGESKKYLKTVLKNFAVYEVYKVMNPRRIAGETAKDNYRHNMAVGGERLAGKHTGGKKEDIAKYSQKDLKAAKRIENKFKKSNGFSL